MWAASRVPGRGPELISSGSPSSVSGRTRDHRLGLAHVCAPRPTAPPTAPRSGPAARSVLTFACSAAVISCARHRDQPVEPGAVRGRVRRVDVRPPPAGSKRICSSSATRRHPPAGEDALLRAHLARCSSARAARLPAVRCTLDRRRGRAVDRRPVARGARSRSAPAGSTAPALTGPASPARADPAERRARSGSGVAGAAQSSPGASRPSPGSARHAGGVRPRRCPPPRRSRSAVRPSGRLVIPGFVRGSASSVAHDAGVAAERRPRERGLAVAVDGVDHGRRSREQPLHDAAVAGERRDDQRRPAQVVLGVQDRCPRRASSSSARARLRARRRRAARSARARRGR